MNKYKESKNSSIKNILLYGICIALILLGSNQASKKYVSTETGISEEELDYEISKLHGNEIELESDLANLMIELEKSKMHNPLFDHIDNQTIDSILIMDRDCDWFKSSQLKDPRTMHASEYIKAVIKCFEGYRSSVYKIGNDFTVGYGHSLGSNYDGKMEYTESECDSLLNSDIEECENVLKSSTNDWIQDRKFAGLTQGMYDALVMYIFHIGRGNFRINSDVTDNLLDKSRYDLVPDTLRNCNVKKGFDTRRALEALIFMGEKVDPRSLRSAPATLDTTIFNGLKKITKDDLLRK